MKAVVGFHSGLGSGIPADSKHIKGSVLVWHGSLWHGGGANTTADEWRCGVNVQYCPGFVRQQQNPYFGVPPEIAATITSWYMITIW